MNPTRHQPDDPWEVALNRALKRLPEREAPPTLIPRVHAAMDSRSVANDRRRLWRVPAHFAAAAAVTAMVLWFAVLVTGVTSWLERTGIWNTVADALALTVGALIPNGTQMALTCAAILLSAMFLTCIGLGSAVYRVARST